MLEIEHIDLDLLATALADQSADEYQWTIDPATGERAARRLARSLQGRGAFRRFRNELHDEHPELVPAWNAFRDTRAARRAVEWLLDNKLIDDDAADRYRRDHPDPSVQ